MRTNRTATTALAAVVAGLIFFAGCPGGAGVNEKVVLARAMAAKKAGLEAFREWRRSPDALSTEAATAADRARERLAAAQEDFEWLADRHSHRDPDGMLVLDDGYEYLEVELGQIQQHVYDLGKDSAVGD